MSKTYLPDQSGAKRFALRYGGQLVCVRQRLSADGKRRYTTVELLVESHLVTPRQPTLVALSIPPSDRDTRALLLACGADWQPRQRYWLVPQRLAKTLRLMHHQVPISA